MTEMIKVIVKCKDVGSCTNIVRQMSGTIVHVHSSINALTISIPKDKLEEIKEDPNTEYVEVTSPNDVQALGFKSKISISSDQLKVLASSQVVPWGISKIRATQIQDGGNKGTGVKVCILDTGIDNTHEDLKGSVKLQYNFTNNTNDAADGYGHGMHVAGTIGARDNGVGVIGVAPECDFMIGKVLDNNGSGSYDWIVAGIQWAIDNGANIVSMSFGGGGSSQALSDICNAAKTAGVILVASAGNSNGNGSTNTIGYPAKFDSVIAVAATDANDARASFSSTGKELWVTAPGVNILSTMLKSGKLSNPSGYGNLSGTSMSCPHVSGMIALMLKANPSLSPDDVKTILSKSSIDLGTTGRDIFYGYGRIDAVNAIDEQPTPTPTPTPEPTPTPTPTPEPTPTPTPEPTPTPTPEPTPSPTPTPSPVLKEIEIFPQSPIITIGKPQSFKATALDQNGKPIPSVTISWSVTDSNIGQFSPQTSVTDSNGNAYSTFNALSIGMTTIDVSNGNILAGTGISIINAPSGNNKYAVQKIGNFGVILTKSPFGGVTADDACKQACSILKDIDSS